MKLIFQCTAINHPREFPGTEEVKLKLVGGDAHANVPQGELSLRVTNPAATGQFRLNEEYPIEIGTAGAAEESEEEASGEEVGEKKKEE